MPRRKSTSGTIHTGDVFPPPPAMPAKTPEEIAQSAQICRPLQELTVVVVQNNLGNCGLLAQMATRHRGPLVDQLMTVSFIDRNYRVTPAERESWSTYLARPATCMRVPRDAFRRVHDGDTPGNAFLAFAVATGLKDEDLLARLEAALEGLARDLGG